MNVSLRLWWCFGLLLLCALLLSCAQQPVDRRTTFSDGFTIITRTLGPIQTQHEGKPKFFSKETIRGRSVIYEKNILLKPTRRVTCGPQDGFLIPVLIYGLPDGEHTLKLEVEHPPFTTLYKGSATYFSRQEKIQSFNAKAPWSYGWIFNDPKERVPGRWTLRLGYRDALILEETFEVIPPATPSPPAS